MTLDFTAFKNKPIKSTATPLDFSAFQKAPIKSTATLLDLTAFQPKTSIIPKQPAKPLVEAYKVPERTPVAQQDFKDVANMAIELGAIVPQAIAGTVQSIREAKKGKALDKFEIPLFKDQKLIIQGVQRNYEDRLNAGQSDREAFIGSSLEFGLDLAFTLGSMKSVARKALLKTPEKLVSRQIIADTKTVRDYVAGRSNYLGVEVPPELKTAWSKLSSPKKKEVLKGIIQLEKVVPNRLAKILGVSEAEITKLVPKTRIVAEERRLPGYAPEGKPAFGLSIEKRKPVGFGEKMKPLVKEVEKYKTADEFVKNIEQKIPQKEWKIIKDNVFQKEYKNDIFPELSIKLDRSSRNKPFKVELRKKDTDGIQNIIEYGSGKDFLKNLMEDIEDGRLFFKNIENLVGVSGRQKIQTELGGLEEFFSKVKPTPTPKPTLQQEARKYKSADDVLDTVNPTGGLYVDYTPKKRATMELEQNMTTLDKTSKKTPDTKITIYRGVPKTQNEIVAGDFITTNKDLAKTYGENVISKEVKLGDILDDIESPLGEEYLYRPGASKELKDIKYDYTKSKWYENYSKYLNENKEKFPTIKSWFDGMKASGKTKSQLKDIWEKAQGVIPSAKVKTEAIPKVQDKYIKPTYKKPTTKEVKVSSKEVKITPKKVKEFIGEKPAPFIRKRETTLLKTRIKEIQKLAISKASKKAKIQQLKNEFNVKLEKAVRKEQLKTVQVGITQRIKGIAKGVRESRVLTKNEIQNTQTEIIDILDKSKLDLNDKAKFIKVIKNVQTTKQLKKILPQIEKRIKALEQKAEIKKIKIQIKKELKEKTTRRDRSGVIVGRVSIEAQRELNKISQILKLTQEKALNLLDEIAFTKIGENLEISDEIANEIMLLRYASGIDDKIIAKNLLANIRSIKETGKTLRALQIENQLATTERMQDAFINTITGGKGLSAGTGISPTDLPSAETKFLSGLKNTFASGEDLSLMPTFLFDKISRLDTGSKYMQSSLNKWWRQVFENRNIKDKSIDLANKDIKQGISDIFEVKTDSREYRKLLTEIIDVKREIGIFKDIDNKTFTMKMTGSQAMYHWGQQQNPNVLPTYKETMGWSNEMIGALDKSLSAKEKKFVRFIGDGEESFFGRFRNGEIDDLPLDPIYEKQFGTPLGRVDGMYIPLQRDKDTPAFIQLLQDTTRNLSTKPSAIKARLKNKTPINLEAGLFETTQNHIMQISHYKAFSDFINQGRKIFVGDVRTALKQNFRDANEILKIIDGTFNDLAKDGITQGKNIKILNNLRGNTAVAYIGANPVSATKQYVSVIAWAGEMPTTKFIQGMTNFSKNPMSKTNFLVENSQTLKSRFQKGSLERDIQQGMRSGELDNIKSSNTAKQVFTILTRINDRVAIVGGGWGKYIYELERITGLKVPTNVKALKEFIGKHPKAHKEAINLFEEATVRTQQAGNIENLSQLQRLGSVGDLFTLFQSAPIAQFGNTLSTLRAMGFFGDPKRIPTGRGLKRLFIYLVAIPSLLQFMADGFDWKPRRQAAAVGASVATLGFSNYPMFVGQLITSIGRTVAGLPAFDIGTPAPATVLNEFIQATKQNREIEINGEDIFNAIKDFGVAIATLKGIPAKPTERIIEGAIKVATEDADKRLLVGYSEFALGEQGLEKQDRINKQIDNLLKLDNENRENEITRLKEEDTKTLSQIRAVLKNKYKIVGSTSDNEFISVLSKLPKKEQDILINTYSETTQRTIRRKLQHPKSTTSKTEFLKALKKAVDSGEITHEKAKRLYNTKYK